MTAVYLSNFYMILGNARNALVILKLFTKLKERRDCSFFRSQCTTVKCDWFRVFSTSKLIDKEVKRGKVPYDVNIRTISAFREMGKGHVDIETFCRNMNMPPPMNKTTYQDSVKEIHSAYAKTAEDSMKAAALELREMVVDNGDDNDGIANVDVSVDGTWRDVVLLP